MKKLNSIKILLTTTLFIILSTFVTSGATFDNILKVIFYTYNDTSYLILHESLYHPTSGSYEQGNLRTQGYSTSRISVYSMENGNMLAQKEMGKMDSTAACYILGCSSDNLWIYCNKFKSGLQSFYPTTLRKNISQANIYKSLNISIGRFYEPKWQEIKMYYGYDVVQQKLIITNSDHQQYYIDVETFATQPILDKIIVNKSFNKYLDESVSFKDSAWVLEGYDFMKFQCGKYKTATPSYLYGKFILEQNKIRLFKHFFNIQESLQEIKPRNTIDEKKIDILITKSQNNINKIIKGNKPDEVLLQTSDNSFYVWSKQSKNPDAYIKISKVKSDKFGVFNEVWSTSPPGVFYNVAQARNTRKFKQYFGEKIPEFDYQLIQIYNNNLIIIYLQQVCCINTQTGNILWQFKLR